MTAFIKTNYTREETEALCRKALHTKFPEGICFEEDADKWIKRNLK